MIRDQTGDVAYWDEVVSFSNDVIKRISTELLSESGDASYRPQYVFELAKEHWHLALSKYSRGDDVRNINTCFGPLLDAWEESVRLGKDVFTPEQQYTRRSWAVNLDHYIVCFWLVGFALALEIPEEQWARLLVLVDNEGEDRLLDTIIATRQPGRKIGASRCHPRPYQRLLTAIEASSDQQACLLAEFVQNWFAELDRPAKKGNAPATAVYQRPYWYTLGNRQLHDSGYFGRWCVEAVAAVKAFGLDDHLCLGLPSYPGDLLRPEGPTTHLPHVVGEAVAVSMVDTPPAKRQGLLSRLFGRNT